MALDHYKAKIAQMKEALNTPGSSCADDLDALVDEAVHHLLHDILGLIAELEALHHTTPFSRLSLGEIKLVAQKDRELAYVLEDFWLEDEEYCMRLDFLREDFLDDLACGRTECKTLDEYRAQLRHSHQISILHILEDLVTYAETR